MSIGTGKIRAMTPVGAASNRTASAQLETAPTKHGERKRLFIFIIHYNYFRSCKEIVQQKPIELISSLVY